ncbi:MAG: FAD-binding oxidoreductase [Anaerolineales bacterium]|nr:FAD-binding oxidoreductase [Anaerolineales bacterium]
MLLSHLSPLENFGHSLKTAAYLFRPANVEQIVELFQLAERENLTIGLRGAGRTYGDGALNGGHIVLDIRRMNRILEWNPQTGVIKVEPGVTIQQLWQYVLEDGWWPPVVSGTQFPTLSGALGMNIHGKNNWHAGTIGEHVLAFTALLPNGQEIMCTPDENSELFYSLISGAGLLGVFTSMTFKLKRLYSGNVRVSAWAVPTLREMLTDLDQFKNEHDYIVGWLDGIAGGNSIGRGQIHGADYLHADEDPQATRTLKVDYQNLPDTFFGVVPKSMLWLGMQFFMNNAGTTLVNTAKYVQSRYIGHQKQYIQSLVAFNFLLDYVPNWEKAYGAGGLIQYQSFLPLETANAAWTEMLRLTQRRGLPTYLGVTKRHRADKFLFTHAVNGFSFAMDFKVTRGNRAKLQQMAEEMNQIVLQAGGRFYFAKDSTLTPEVAARYLGQETLQRFAALKAQCDPHERLQTGLYRRLLKPILETAQQPTGG